MVVSWIRRLSENEVYHRTPRRKPGSTHGSGVGVFCWVVERTLGVAASLPPPALRYERRADVYEAFLTLGCSLTTWRYLKREV